MRVPNTNIEQFSQWQSNYDLAFDTYVQLQEAFGWSAFKAIFANYQHLSPNECPTNDQEKIDLWMVMFSTAVEENLAEFFISWGFPISTEAIDLVGHLPPTSLRNAHSSVVLELVFIACLLRFTNILGCILFRNKKIK